MNDKVEVIRVPYNHTYPAMKEKWEMMFTALGWDFRWLPNDKKYLLHFRQRVLVTVTHYYDPDQLFKVAETKGSDPEQLIVGSQIYFANRRLAIGVIPDDEVCYGAPTWAFFGRCTLCGQYSYYSELSSYRMRKCGHHEGDSYNCPETEPFLGYWKLANQALIP